MRLILSHSDVNNTDISDEEGRKLYNTSTPTFAWNDKTTITKYPHGEGGNPEIMGIIEYHMLHDAKVQFMGKEVMLKDLLKEETFSSGRYFIGPDDRKYVRKHNSSTCQLYEENSDMELVKFHQKNWGIMKPSHPPYLDISSSVEHMLDLVIITYLCADKLREDEERAKERRHREREERREERLDEFH
ncbi:hypothetical protein HYDPIDRAFT_119575 [Hydnomerulius pinastri MD-312]|uniref:DUF6593 domain-containing protein n=1 Tax=Hydnomerulius pinastri MD-312 TaxID=994086 RepID=A0A0C9UZC6_9AGAM|nr:hypothetical protein HYDPIDRAFT_119575 [Hydnomerulius pinastri MD-312]